jgi:poly-gamma-glutamate synthase PgsB/CapB
MTLILPALGATWLLYLLTEAFLLNRWRRAIPLRITVTGTRGKTTVARMLASVLRESGRRVVAKTTGSEPALLLPDGSEEPIRRRGRASILEQKRLLRRARREEAQVLVAEAMSLHPENHRAEARGILRPHYTLATNFRVDHVAAAGESREEVAWVLGWGVAAGARIYVPEGELEEAFARQVGARGGELTVVPEPWPVSPSPEARADAGPAGVWSFPENESLVRALCRELGVEGEEVHRGLRKAGMDVGAPEVWQVSRGSDKSGVRMVNAFAANDPESTERLLARCRQLLAPAPAPGPIRARGEHWAGLLLLRGDRGDRTHQWIRALTGGFLEELDTLAVWGIHGQALRRKVLRSLPPEERQRWKGKLRVLKEKDPEALSRAVLQSLPPAGGVVFGFGNIVGQGERLVRYWRKVGRSHGA